MNTDNRLSRALEDLSDVPGPASLADRALRQAKSRRIKGYAAGTTAAFAAAALIAAPFLFAPTGGSVGGQFAASTPSASASASYKTSVRLCDSAPMVEPGVKEVVKQNWPGYVKAAVDRLPAREDYVMQSGTVGLCRGESYAVVNLGHLREQGHVTVLLRKAPHEGIAENCAQAAVNPAEQPGPDKFKLLFCAEGKGFKLVYGIDDGYNSYRVYAVYPDGRTVSMESLGRGGGARPVLSAEQLRTVVTDLAMAAFLDGPDDPGDYLPTPGPTLKR